MKRIILVVVLLTCLPFSAQETRHAPVHPSPDPADDGKRSGQQVPDVFAISGNLKRMVVLRFKYGTDLLSGLEDMVKQEKIRNAVILSGMGSVRNFQVHQVGNRDLPPKDVYVKNATAPADIISMSGVVIDGRVHPHITLANADKAFGGHLEPDTTVFTFAIVTLGVLDDSVDLSKFDDWNYR